MSKRITENEIVVILIEVGMVVKNICRKYDFGNLTFYKWREKQVRHLIAKPPAYAKARSHQ